MAAQTKYTVERDFGPLRLSHEELVAVVARLRSLSGAQEGAQSGTRVDESLSLSDGRSTATLSGDISVEALASAPAVATSMTYRYWRNGGAVARISLNLGDVMRRLEVEGHSRDHVEATASAVTEMLNSAGAVLGGFHRRSYGGGVLVLLGLMLPAFASAAGTVALRWVMTLTGPLLSLSVWRLPWERWLPGTAVYRGDVSFVVRHAAGISFAGLVLTIITFALSVIKVNTRLHMTTVTDSVACSPCTWRVEVARRSRRQ